MFRIAPRQVHNTNSRKTSQKISQEDFVGKLDPHCSVSSYNTLKSDYKDISNTKI